MFSASPAVRSTLRGSHRVGALALVALVGVLLLALIAPMSQASAAPRKKAWKPKAGAFFNQPRSSPANENRLENQVLAAVRNTPKGEYIRMAMFSYDRWPVTDALIAARKRGVRVQVVLNGHELTPAAKRIKSYLGPRYGYVKRKVKVTRPNGKVVTVIKKKRYNRKNFFYQCVSSCRGDGDVQHSKFVLFTRSGDARNVVMVGSLNMKVNGTHNQFNDLLVMNNRRRMHDDLAKVFAQMRNDRVLRNPYRDFIYGDGTQLLVMPFARKYATAKTKWTPARDPMTKFLNPIQCLGAKTPSGRTAIRVNMHAWDRERGAMIARKMRDLYARGCDVKLMVGFAGANVRNILAQPTSRGVVPVRSTGYDTDYDGEIDLYSHTKYFTVNGRYGKKNGVRMIVTGSSNYQNGGQYGDELFLRAYNARLHTQYVTNWNDVWAHHTHGFTWSQTYNRGTGRPMYTLTDPQGATRFDWRKE